MDESENLQIKDQAEKVLKIEIIVNQALIDVLIAKKIISEEELVAGIRKIRQEQESVIRKSNKVVSMKM